MAFEGVLHSACEHNEQNGQNALFVFYVQKLVGGIGFF